MAGEVRFTDAETKELVAHSYVTLMASPRPQDVVPDMLRSMRTTGSMTIPFPEFVGMRNVAPGVAEIELVEFVKQASQSLQGGLFGLLAEVAAESLTARAGPGPRHPLPERGAGGAGPGHRHAGRRGPRPGRGA